ncbi:type II toxin-antitoxin system RelE/ParE family toxin [Aliarcobacter cryaerophilus]|uniref:type II toxin-antitoxin system RelE/ParE family toxin n=1 Tax=Aliarcobacter cryaerophilus TaxID=28198 RepID=UPI0021B3025E|nr:type II toxin-antitoxin system RelE/ParE family toxin [Aliarcobacter cryaerophilus]MCT7507176.1 type II toxin-antitoxin system RelE/ParE family toxin [Aliarcobacter cryaerophilus]
MTIIRDEKYILKLQSILGFIAKDSFGRAKQFKNNLDNQIDNLANMPFKCRKSIYFSDDNIRDLIFMRYVIPYKIYESKNKIIIIGINKYKNNLF